MRVLLSTTGSRGDVEPLLALAARLRALGAEVRMCAPPDARERLTEVGVPLVPVGQSMRDATRQMQRTSPEDESRREAEALAEQFATIPAAAEGCDAVVTTGALHYVLAARSTAEKLRIPYFYAAFSPIYLPPPDEPSRVDRDQRNHGFYERFGGLIDSQRAAIGLPPVTRLYDYCFTGRPFLAADPLLAPLWRGQDAVQTGAWTLPDERPLSTELEAFLAAGSPPVYVGFGSSPGTGDAARVAVEAIRAKGRRVVFSRGGADSPPPDDGADCFAVTEVNLQALFGRVAAVVHHSGGGTTHVAARAGVPQVVLPRMMDEPYFAERVAELGIGVALDDRALAFDSMSAALATALAPETRARASEVGRTVRTDGATVAAEVVLAAVAREISV
jgi:UDP:flavonoid glycosyltransferase YjiC (YdhE family)